MTLVSSTLTVALRCTRKFIRTPALLLGGSVSGILFLLIFRYVFGGAVGPIGHLPYVDFLAPGFIVTSVIFSAMNSGTGVAEDLEGGLVDRLRSLPIPAVSVVTGRILADTLMASWGLVLTAGASFAVGLRLHNGVGSALEALGLAVLFAMAFCWLFTALGFFAGGAQAAQSLSFLVFPLSFVSSAYVPTNTMPGWMQAFANYQPVTPMVNSARILVEGQAAVVALGHGLDTYLPAALLWTAGIILVTAPVCAWRLRTA